MKQWYPKNTSSAFDLQQMGSPSKHLNVLTPEYVNGAFDSARNLGDESAFGTYNFKNDGVNGNGFGKITLFDKVTSGPFFEGGGERFVEPREVFLKDREVFLKDREVFLKDRELYPKDTEAFLEEDEKPFLKDTEAFLKDTEAFLKDREAFPKNTEAFLKNTEAYPKDTEAVPKDTEQFSDKKPFSDKKSPNTESIEETRTANAFSQFQILQSNGQNKLTQGLAIITNLCFEGFDHVENVPQVLIKLRNVLMETIYYCIEVNKNVYEEFVYSISQKSKLYMEDLIHKALKMCKTDSRSTTCYHIIKCVHDITLLTFTFTNPYKFSHLLEQPLEKDSSVGEDVWMRDFQSGGAQNGFNLVAVLETNRSLIISMSEIKQNFANPKSNELVNDTPRDLFRFEFKEIVSLLERINSILLNNCIPDQGIFAYYLGLINDKAYALHDIESLEEYLCHFSRLQAYVKQMDVSPFADPFYSQIGNSLRKRKAKYHQKQRRENAYNRMHSLGPLFYRERRTLDDDTQNARFNLYQKLRKKGIEIHPNGTHNIHVTSEFLRQVDKKKRQISEEIGQREISENKSERLERSERVERSENKSEKKSEKSEKPEKSKSEKSKPEKSKPEKSKSEKSKSEKSKSEKSEKSHNNHPHYQLSISTENSSEDSETDQKVQFMMHQKRLIQSSFQELICNFPKLKWCTPLQSINYLQIFVDLYNEIYHEDLVIEQNYDECGNMEDTVIRRMDDVFNVKRGHYNFRGYVAKEVKIPEFVNFFNKDISEEDAPFSQENASGVQNGEGQATEKSVAGNFEAIESINSKGVQNDFPNDLKMNLLKHERVVSRYKTYQREYESRYNEAYEVLCESEHINHTEQWSSYFAHLKAGFDSDRKHITNCKIGQVESKIGQVESKIGQVESKIGQVESKIDQVESKIGQVESKIDQVESKIGQVENKKAFSGSETGDEPEKQHSFTSPSASNGQNSDEEFPQGGKIPLSLKVFQLNEAVAYEVRNIRADYEDAHVVKKVEFKPIKCYKCKYIPWHKH